jgi:hypothetical protein
MHLQIYLHVVVHYFLSFVIEISHYSFRGSASLIQALMSVRCAMMTEGNEAKVNEVCPPLSAFSFGLPSPVEHEVVVDAVRGRVFLDDLHGGELVGK